MSDKVVVSWEEFCDKFWGCVDKFNKNLSDEFGIEIYIAEDWSNILSSLVDQHIEFTMTKKGE